MITVKCDYCGKRIESTNDQVNLDFNAYGVSGFPYHNLEYQFHTECAIRVKNKLEDFLKDEESEVAERREDIENSPADCSTPSVTDSKGERNEQ